MISCNSTLCLCCGLGFHVQERSERYPNLCERCATGAFETEAEPKKEPVVFADGGRGPKEAA